MCVDIAPNVFMGLENNDVQIVELERQTIEISNKFKKILVELFKFIESNGSARSKLKWFMSSQKCIPSIYCKSNKDYDSLDFSNSVDIMEVLVDHCSFFNYEMLDDAVNVVDFKKGKEMLQLHKENFKAYTQNRVMECPTSLGKTNSDQRCCYVFLDDNFKYYKQVYLKQLHHDISKILNRSIKDVRVGGVYTGSVVVILHLSASLVNEVFPLTQEKVELIKNIDYEGAHILKILCEFHSYTFDSTMEGWSILLALHELVFPLCMILLVPIKHFLVSCCTLYYYLLFRCQSIISVCRSENPGGKFFFIYV